MFSIETKWSPNNSLLSALKCLTLLSTSKKHRHHHHPLCQQPVECYSVFHLTPLFLRSSSALRGSLPATSHPCCVATATCRTASLSALPSPPDGLPFVVRLSARVCAETETHFSIFVFFLPRMLTGTWVSVSAPQNAVNELCAIWRHHV